MHRSKKGYIKYKYVYCVLIFLSIKNTNNND